MSSNLTDGLLIWNELIGYGFHTAKPITYDENYFKKYRAMDKTEMGAALTKARIGLVKEFYDSDYLIDIGIGGGIFVEQTGFLGYDVSDEAVKWLRKMDSYADPYECNPDAITCWDSLEHIPEPEALISQVRKFVFVSMPIYKNKADCLSSKHYKPGEHIHYWTHEGLIKWFEKRGFVCMEYNDIESHLGREGIISYVFQRI